MAELRGIAHRRHQRCDYRSGFSLLSRHGRVASV